VVSRASLAPIAGAKVQIVGTSNATTTGADGAYVLVATPDTYTVEASALDMGYATRQASAAVAAASTTQLDFKLNRVAVKTWDVSADYSITNGNPNGDWCYGRTDGDFILWDGTLYTDPGLTYGDRAMWWEAATQGASGYVMKLMRDVPQDLTGVGYPQYFDARQVILYPGANGQPSVVRWTAPLSGDIAIDARFSGQNVSPTVTDAHVRHNDEDVFSAPVSGFAGRPPSRGDAFGNSPVQLYSGILTVAAGDTIEFAIGFGSDFTGLYDQTGLAATIVGPDPSVTAVSRLADLKDLPDGKLVTINSDQVVTVASGTFADGSCYVEDPGRPCGIKIVLGSGVPGVARGDRIQFAGSMGTDDNDERFVNVTSITSKTGGEPLGSLGMANKAVVGSGITGLLVRVWGSVISKAGDGSYAAIDDGGGTRVRIALTGLTVPLTKSVDIGDYLGVTGVASIAADGSSQVIIRPRGDADIRIF